MNLTFKSWALAFARLDSTQSIVEMERGGGIFELVSLPFLFFHAPSRETLLL